MPKQKKQTILQEAQTIVYGDRQKDYGPVKENFSRIARQWSVTLGMDVTEEQVALCMIQVKIARHIHSPKRDNIVDIAGYAATIEKMENE